MPPSRQAEWQQKMRAQGRCQVCGQEQYVEAYCKKHHDMRVEKLRIKSEAQGSKKQCSYCFIVGHNRRGCPIRKKDIAEGKEDGEGKEYDDAVRKRLAGITWVPKRLRKKKK